MCMDFSVDPPGNLIPRHSQYPGAVPPPQKKFEFLPENGGFWCILGLLFTFMQKFVRPMGGRPPPLDPPLLVPARRTPPRLIRTPSDGSP